MEKILSFNIQNDWKYRLNQAGNRFFQENLIANRYFPAHGTFATHKYTRFGNSNHSLFTSFVLLLRTSPLVELGDSLQCPPPTSYVIILYYSVSVFFKHSACPWVSFLIHSVFRPWEVYGDPTLFLQTFHSVYLFQSLGHLTAQYFPTSHKWQMVMSCVLTRCLWEKRQYVSRPLAWSHLCYWHLRSCWISVK